MACSAKAVNVPDRSKAHTPRLDVIGFEEPSSGTERPIGKRPLRAVPKWIGTLPMLFRGNEKLLVMWNCDTWNGADSRRRGCFAWTSVRSWRVRRRRRRRRAPPAPHERRGAGFVVSVDVSRRRRHFGFAEINRFCQGACAWVCAPFDSRCYAAKTDGASSPPRAAALCSAANDRRGGDAGRDAKKSRPPAARRWFRPNHWRGGASQAPGSCDTRAVRG